jgi:hypothetical protein
MSYAEGARDPAALVARRKRRGFPTSCCSSSIRTSSPWAATGTRKTCWPAKCCCAARESSMQHRPRRRRHVSRARADRGLSDLRSARMEARRGAYVRAIEQVMIDTLAISASKRARPGCTGVWVECQNRRHRRTYQPLGDVARLRAECYDRFELLPVHRAVRPYQTGDVHAELGSMRRAKT